MKKFLLGVGAGIILTFALGTVSHQYHAAKARQAAVAAAAAVKTAATQAPAR